MIRAFLANDFYRLRAEVDQKERRIKISFDSLHRPDKRLSAIIGDAVSTLRSTLDYITVALVKPLGVGPEVIFPFADNAQGLQGQAKGAKTTGLCPLAIQEFIINSIQPYQGGNGHTLWVLNKLRNIDKHRFLLSDLRLAGLYVWCKCGGLTLNEFLLQTTAGNDVLLFNIPFTNFEFTNEPRPAFEVTLTEAAYPQGEPIVHFLNSAAGQIKGILDALQVLVMPLYP